MSESKNNFDEFEDPLSNYDPPEFSSAVQQRLAEEPVSEIPCNPTTFVSPNSDVEEALQTMLDKNISCVMVTEQDRLVGVFTERDVLEKLSDWSSSDPTLVGDVMTRDPVVVYDNQPAGVALSAIAVAGYRHVPVLDMDKKVVGVLSPRRVFAFLSEMAK